MLLYAGSKEPVVTKMRQVVKLLSHGEFKLLSGLDHAQAYWRGDIAGTLIKEYLAKQIINQHLAIE